MKQILLTQGKVALVDDADYERLNRHKWYAQKQRGGNWYAMRVVCKDGKRTTVRMHREILKTPVGMETDHKDNNGLNNRQGNLRVATHAQNQCNRKKRTGLSSQYKGVCWHRHAAKWQAHVRVRGKKLYLGYFLLESEAAQAYDGVARKYFGEYAQTNF